MNSRDYWKKRQEETEAKMFRKSKGLEKALKQEYIIAERNIKKSINDLVGTYMKDNNLDYKTAMEYLTKSEYKTFKKSIKQYIAEIESLSMINPEASEKLQLELNTVAMRSRITRLDSLTVQINQELNRTAFTANRELEKLVSDVYSENYKIVTSELGLTGVNTVLPVKDIERLIRIPWSGASYSERIWNNRDRLSQVVKEEITQNMIQGTNVRKLASRIKDRMAADYSNAERVARTELNYALNQSSKLAYEKAGVKRYEYHAEQGERTCTICSRLNGNVYDMEEFTPGDNAPPMHPRCRCTHLPVIEEI